MKTTCIKIKALEQSDNINCNKETDSMDPDSDMSKDLEEDEEHDTGNGPALGISLVGNRILDLP